MSNVDHPKHYNENASGIECIDVVEHMGFNLGNAIKYCWRADHKGNAQEDLEKAKWYIEREIEKRKKFGANLIDVRDVAPDAPWDGTYPNGYRWDSVKAKGFGYAHYREQGWTDTQLIEEGLLVAID